MGYASCTIVVSCAGDMLPIRLVISVPHPAVALDTKVAIVALLQLPTEQAPFNQESTVLMIEDPEPCKNKPESPEALIH